MQFLRTQPHKLILQIVVSLFNKSLTTVHSALKRLRIMKEAVDPESANAANFSRLHSGLTCSGELNVTGWIEARRGQYDCPSPTEVRTYAGRLLLQ
jgi:hypothetical protein